MPRVANHWLREILRVLYMRRTMTRADLIQATGLNPASVSHALRLLLQNGVILKVGELQSNGGRPREVLNLNPETGYFVAVDMEGRSIRFALTSFVGDIRCRWEEDFEFGQPLSVRRVLEGISRLWRELDASQAARVLAIGVSHPGLLDERGRLTALNLGWRKFPLVDELRQSLDYPIFFEHDKHTCLQAERWLGCAQHYQSGLFVIIERGIGAGIFLDGKTVHGWRDMSGELGHCKVEPDAEDLCVCGQKGCLEAIASSPNIIRQYREKAGLGSKDPAVRVTDVFEKARQGDPVALEVMDRVGRALGRGLSWTASLLNPEVIIVGGDAISGEDILLPRIQEEMRCCTIPELLEGMKIIASGLGLDIRLRGAASLAFRKCLADAELLEKMCSGILLDQCALPLAKG
jgi:predicted NBD/HSP70 family sugar kinase